MLDKVRDRPSSLSVMEGLGSLSGLWALLGDCGAREIQTVYPEPGS